MTKKIKIKKEIIETPRLMVDIVLFKVIDNTLKLLLIRRGVKPFKNMWALPGGHVDKNEALEKAAFRELEEETGVKNIYLEQLYTFGDPYRDPRGRAISVAYFALGESGQKFHLKSATDAAEVDWFSVKKLPRLAFDHKKIINYALKRLCWKLEYTNIARNLLPKLFTLSELQKTYEVVLGKKIDKRNFRKKIVALNLIKPIKKQKKNVAYRPPQLWTFVAGKNLILDKRELIF